MRLISLNTWAGQVMNTNKEQSLAPLVHYLRDESENTDVFCLQEIFHSDPDGPARDMDYSKGRSVVAVNLYSEISEILPGFDGYFTSFQDGFLFAERVEYKISFGMAIFVRRGLEIQSSGEIFIYKERNTQSDNDATTIPKSLQYVELGGVLISQFHGLWNAGPKTDTADRLEQSRRVKEFLDSKNLPKILCGDFNLLPNTESLAILEEGMENLVKTRGIQSTRSAFYKKPVRFADYVLVSQEIKVKDFHVPDVEVSDHLPMVLDFEL